MAKKPTIMTTSSGNPVADNQTLITREIMQALRPGTAEGKCLAVGS